MGSARESIADKPKTKTESEGRVSLAGAGRYLKEFSDAKANNLDFLRLLLAGLVVVTHSFVVFSTSTLQEPLLYLTNGQLSLGSLAVDGFFVISGFLITASWQRVRGLADFTRRRVARIYPGFIVCCVICAVLIAPLGAPDVGRYFHELDLVRFVKNALLLNRIDLPEMPRLGPGTTLEVNGSLWSIKIEFECYVLVAVLGLAGLLKRARFPLFLLVVVFSLWIIDEHPSLVERLPLAAVLQRASTHFRFATFFLLGTVAYLARDRIPFDPRLFLLACALFALGARTNTMTVCSPVAIAYAIFFVGFHPAIHLHDVAANRDLSYGIYLYGWPVQYAITVLLERGMNPILLSVAALLLSAICAVASWTFVEGPSLAFGRKARLTSRVRA